MKVLVLTAAIALGGCSLIAETRHPYKTARGTRTCQSYALPVIDSLVGASSLAVGGLALWLGATDRELRELVPVSFLLLAIGTPSAIGAFVGFHDIPRCHDELDAK